MTETEPLLHKEDFERGADKEPELCVGVQVEARGARPEEEGFTGGMKESLA